MPELENVETLKENWAYALMTKGIIVKLTISKWNGSSKLTPESLGIKFEDQDVKNFYYRYLDLGKQKLMPPEIRTEIVAAETEAREILLRYSFNTVWGKFVPYVVFADWKRENDESRINYMEVAKKITNKYDEIVLILRKEYSKLAKDVWSRLYPDNREGMTESFLNKFLENIISLLPERMDFISSFDYKISYTIIPLPSFIEEDLSKVEDIKRNNMVKNEEARLELEAKKIIKNEYIEKKKELIDSFLNQTVEKFRDYIATYCNDMLTSINKRTVDLTSNTRHKLMGFIKRVKKMNFYGDKDMNIMLNELEIEINKFKGERDIKLIKEKIDNLAKLAKQELKAENYNPTLDCIQLENI